MAKSNLKASRQDEYANAVALAELLTSGYGRGDPEAHPQLMQLARDLGIVKKTTASRFDAKTGRPIGPSETSFYAPTPEERLGRKKKVLKHKREARLLKDLQGIKGGKGERLKLLKKVGKLGGWPLVLLMGMLPMLMGEEE